MTNYQCYNCCYVVNPFLLSLTTWIFFIVTNNCEEYFHYGWLAANWYMFC